MRALAFNPDDTLPKSFDMDRVEVLRGPQGTLFGAGSEGGTVRYITTQPSLTQTSDLRRSEALVHAGRRRRATRRASPHGGPIIDGTLGARAAVWYRRDGGWIDRVDPGNPHDREERQLRSRPCWRASRSLWAPSDKWTVTPSIYYQDRVPQRHRDYWPIYSNPGRDNFNNATRRSAPMPG
jgi:iron complex outermembrane recepter protein